MATSEDQAQILEAAQGDDEQAEVETTPVREVPEAELHADDTPEQPEQEPAETEEPASEQPQGESEQVEEMAEPSGEVDVAPQEAPEISEPPAEPTPDIDEPVPQTDDSPPPTTDMQALEQDLESFRHCIENIGTQLDDEMNRQDMRKLRADIREKATRMENDLKDRQRNKDKMEPQQRVHLQQVTKQLDAQLNTYHELLERERAMTRRYPLVGTEALERNSRTVADQAATPRQAQQMLKANAKDREREQAELVELESDIIGLQSIQTELAGLIGEQDDDVKLIEQRVEHAGDRVEHGHNQMVQTVNMTRTNKKMICVVATIVSVVVAGLVILAVVIVAVILAQRG